MNYRHAFHAGNFADVHKHMVLSLIVQALCRKPTPFAVIDTHAGVGAYELDADQASRTMEWTQGIARVLAAGDAPPDMQTYLDVVLGLNGQGPFRRYPGSPVLAQRLIRPQDRLVLCELHDQDVDTLRRRMGGDARVGVHHRDGYEGLGAFLPPKERRGVVLIDPPYEQRDEFAAIKRALTQALTRWPTGIYALWYPIKARSQVERFHQDLQMLGLPKTLISEIYIHADDAPDRLNGAGMVVINPPWMLDQTLAGLSPWLAPVLEQVPGQGGFRVDWLVADV